MRPLIFGDPFAEHLKAAKEGLEANGLRPVFRNPQFFKARDLEAASLVVITDGEVNQFDIAEAYETAGVEVRVISAVEAPADEEAYEQVAMRAKLAELDAKGELTRGEKALQTRYRNLLQG